MKKKPRDIPVYALDRHTSKGARALKQGLTVDERFSGTDYGRQQTKYLYERDGFITPDEYPDPQFYTYWEQFKSLMGVEESEVPGKNSSVLTPELDSKTRIFKSLQE